MKYDKEEQEILEAYESGRMKLSTPSKKEIEAIKTVAKNTFKKDRRITIRLYDLILPSPSNSIKPDPQVPSIFFALPPLPKRHTYL
jgi:hypothetical protein